MCESKVFVRKGGKKEMVMEEAVHIAVDGRNILARDIMGNVKEIKGLIKEINIDKHEVLIEAWGK